MDQDSLIFNGKKYISSRRASEITGYTSDYIGQLARGNKVASRMVGRNRFVDENELLEHKASFSSIGPNFVNNFANLDAQVNSNKFEDSFEQLVKARSIHGQTLNGESGNLINSSISDRRDVVKQKDSDKNESLATKISFAGSLLVVILLGVFLNTKPVAQGFRSFAQNVGESSSQLDGASQLSADASKTGVTEILKDVDTVFLGYLHNIDNKIALFFVSVRDKAINIFSDKPQVVYVDNSNAGVTVVDPKANQNQNVEFKVDDAKLKQYVREIMLSERNTFAPGGPYGGVVALPSSGDPVQDEILKQRIKDSFSDEVTVQFDSSGSSGVIRPVFKSGSGLNENYMFLLVPVKK